MIEEAMKIIISELGPTGLLIVGLYFLLLKPLRNMCSHIEIINSETGEIRDAINNLTNVITKRIEHEN